MSLRVIVVDDEPLARRGITARLAREDDVEVVRECATGRAAVKAIHDLRPDLVFLDVQMPGMDGFGVIEAVGVDRMPTTIFVTAYDAHALRAFDAQAIDYLLKPIDDDRLARALARARRRATERRQQEQADRVTALLGALGDPSLPRAATSEPQRLLVKSSGRVVFVDVAEIDWIGAEGDYVRVHMGQASHLVRETMGVMEQRLAAGPFARVHRSALVNVSRIAEVRPLTGREWLVVLQGGSTVRLSRRYREHFARRIGRPL